MVWHKLDCRIDMRPVDELTEVINDQRNGLPSTRHMMFLTKGHACVTCGLVATHVIAWRDARWPDAVGFKGLHVDLIYMDPETGRETLMTADHYIPRSLGGPSTVENLNPMCSPCNNAKGAKPPEGWVDPRTPEEIEAANAKKGKRRSRSATDLEGATASSTTARRARPRRHISQERVRRSLIGQQYGFAGENPLTTLPRNFSDELKLQAVERLKEEGKVE